MNVAAQLALIILGERAYEIVPRPSRPEELSALIGIECRVCVIATRYKVA